MVIPAVAAEVVAVEVAAAVADFTPKYFNDVVWKKIAGLEFDIEGVDLPFSKRLARENRWPQWFALDVIDEYRKFLYLLERAGHPVTPSVEVDQVWHLHLLYSEMYWEDFAEGMPVKPYHGPTRGGNEENEKFTDKGVKAAGTRARKALMELGKLVKARRKEIQEANTQICI